MTKKTPFYWAAVLLIYIEAGIRQAVRSLGAMLSHYVQHYAASVAEVKAQLLKRQSLVVLGINDKRARGQYVIDRGSNDIYLTGSAADGQSIGQGIAILG